VNFIKVSKSVYGSCFHWKKENYSYPLVVRFHQNGKKIVHYVGIKINILIKFIRIVFYFCWDYTNISLG